MQRHHIPFTGTAPATGLERETTPATARFTGDVASMEQQQAKALRGVHARKARVGKAVAAMGDGNYQITLIYENRSSEPRQNVRLEEFIPQGFAISTSQTCEVHQAPDGSRLAWTFDQVAAGEAREISFTVSGHGSLKHPGAKAFK